MDTLDMRYFEAHGQATFDLESGDWKISGTVGWSLVPVETEETLQAQVVFFENLVPDYLVHVTPVDRGHSQIPQAICSNITRQGFKVDLGVSVAKLQTFVGFTFSVRGLKEEVVMDDRSLSKDRLLEDIHAVRLLFTHEAEYGVVTVMCSASIQSDEKSQELVRDEEVALQDAEKKLKDTTDPQQRAELERNVASKQRRLQRLRRLADPQVTRYWKSAYEFGSLWGQYSVNEQKDALRGCYVPLCTGGGPGIMAAAAKGGRDANAQVIGIDSLFGNEQRHNLKESFSIFSNIRLRCNDFALRESALINYSHVILFWPGGYGTCWEVFETLCKIQTKHLRRVRTKAIFVHREFWEPLFDFANHLRNLGTINDYGDRIYIPGRDDQDPPEAYVAEIVNDEHEAFDAARRHVENLSKSNLLSIF